MDTQELTSSLIGQRKERIAKLKKLKEMGINPYPARSKKDFQNSHVVEHFAELEEKDVTLAGRITSRRDHGKVVFMDLSDQSGRIQLYIKDDVIVGNTKESELGWTELELLDIGDFIQITGTVQKPKQGRFLC